MAPLRVARFRRTPGVGRLKTKGTQRDTINHVKYFSWNDEKNATLIQERGISFEEIVFHIESGDVLDLLEHPNRDRYPNQQVFVVNVEGYAYLVPFVEDEQEVFLKTIIPSRKRLGTTWEVQSEQAQEGRKGVARFRRVRRVAVGT